MKVVKPTLDTSEVLNDRLFFMIEDLEEQQDFIDKKKSAIVSVFTFVKNKALTEEDFEQFHNLQRDFWKAETKTDMENATEKFEELKQEVNNKRKVG